MTEQILQPYAFITSYEVLTERSKYHKHFVKYHNMNCKIQQMYSTYIHKKHTFFSVLFSKTIIWETSLHTRLLWLYKHLCCLHPSWVSISWWFHSPEQQILLHNQIWLPVTRRWVPARRCRSSSSSRSDHYSS